MNLSPYPLHPKPSTGVYCANNPVRLVDVDGRDIWIRAADNNEYQYRNGQLYTKSGEVHSKMGLPYRTGYRTIKIYPETGEKKTVFTRMLNRKGEPIKIG